MTKSFRQITVAAQSKFWNRRLATLVPVSGRITDKLSSRRDAAGLADARSSLIAGRTNRAARRRAEMNEGRHPMIWVGAR